MNRILYFTDKFGVSQGYEPAFTRILNHAGIKRHQVAVTNIYDMVDSPLKKAKVNDTIWRFDPEKLPQIRNVVDMRINQLRPALIVVSCPAVLGVLPGVDFKSATLDKLRGGVYYYGESKIPVIVIYPITAINRQVDTRLVKNEDGDSDTQEPYKVQHGKHILNWDWQKVGRFAQGKQRKLPKFVYSICRSIADCVAAKTFLSDCVLISTDIETANFPPQITCVGYTGLKADGTCRSFVIPFYDEFEPDGCFWKSADDHAFAWSIVVDINDTPIPKTMQNGSYDSSYFVRDMAPPRDYFYDSMVMWWSIYMELPKSLDFISSILLDNYVYWKDDIKGDDQEKIQAGLGSMERYWRYNALDCYNTLWNTVYMARIFSNPAAEKLRTNYVDAMLRVYSGFNMSMRGVKANLNRREEIRNELVEQRDKALTRFRYLIDDESFNVNSPQQKLWLLYDFLGVQPRNAKGRNVDRTKDQRKAENKLSSGAIPLRMAKTDHPMFKRIISSMEAAMEPDKQISNVCNMYLRTDRFRTKFNAVGTETTRFSSSGSNFWDGGNIQNIRKKYREWLEADENHIMLDIDYSQSDDVFVGYESQDPDKIEMIESGKDGHAANGELFFGKPYDWIVAGKKAGDPMVVHPITGIRQLSKRAVHGTNFQMAGLTLYVTMGREAVVAMATLLGYPNAEYMHQDQLVAICIHIMGKYRSKYKRLNKNGWYKDIADVLMRTGELTNAYGITRTFLGDPKDNGTQREATAFLGQSGTAGNMNRVMYEVDHGYIRPNFRDGPNPDRHVKPLQMSYDSHGIAFHIQVHDNFVAMLNLNHPRFKEAAHNLLTVMDRPVIIHGREVRVKAEAEIGRLWGKNMLEWNGNVGDLDSLIAKLK